MKFKVGDEIFAYGCIGACAWLMKKAIRENSRGVILEVRKYPGHPKYQATQENGTHYVIKWDVYAQPHEYMREYIDNSCKLIDK